MLVRIYPTETKVHTIMAKVTVEMYLSLQNKLQAMSNTINLTTRKGVVIVLNGKTSEQVSQFAKENHMVGIQPTYKGTVWHFDNRKESD